MLQKNGWIIWLAVFAAALWRRRNSGIFFNRLEVTLWIAWTNDSFIDDPIRRALREGRLRRLTYH